MTDLAEMKAAVAAEQAFARIARKTERPKEPFEELLVAMENRGNLQMHSTKLADQ